jgi:hypothetical protein
MSSVNINPLKSKILLTNYLQDIHAAWYNPFALRKAARFIILQGVLGITGGGHREYEMERWLAVAETNCSDPSREDEFNRWYDDIHVPDALETEGFISVTDDYGYDGEHG